jgi:hypothetical protein
MERRVSKAIFKTKACELFRQLETLGGTVIVTDHGRPTIEIRPYTDRQRNPIEVLRAGIVCFNPDVAEKRVALPAETK